MTLSLGSSISVFVAAKAESRGLVPRAEKEPNVLSLHQESPLGVVRGRGRGGVGLGVQEGRRKHRLLNKRHLQVELTQKVALDF